MTTKRNLWMVVILLSLILIAGCSDSSTGVAKTATVNLGINSEGGGSVIGAVVRLSNNNGNLAHIHERIATSQTVTISGVAYGKYTLIVTHNGHALMDYNFTVQSIEINRIVTLSRATLGSIGPAGGLIFYDKGNYDGGWRFLEAAPVEREFNAEWGAYTAHWDTDNYLGIDVSGTSTAIGSGKRNTELIVTRLAQLKETGRAAQRCQELNINGFKDWFLPSIGELNLMFLNLHRHGLGEFGKDNNSEDWNWYYWSSSQGGNDRALGQNFFYGYQYSSEKYATDRVRACRAF